MKKSHGLHWAKCVGRRPTRLVALKAVVALLLLIAPPLPSVEALKLSSTKDDRENLGMGLLRAVEVVRGRFERAWALVSAPEPSPADLDTALELLQANAKQWESLKPAVTLWTEQENADEAASMTKMNGFDTQGRIGQHQAQRARGKSKTLSSDGTRPSADNQDSESGESIGPYSSPETTSRIYEEAASLLAHNRAVLGQALARSGHMDLGIKHLEIACPEILEYQQNAQGHRNSKSWLDCYVNLVQMYKTQKRFDEAAELMARMPWLPVQDHVTLYPTVANSSALSSTFDEASGPELDHPAAVDVEGCDKVGPEPSVSAAAATVAKVGSSDKVENMEDASRHGPHGDDGVGDVADRGSESVEAGDVRKHSPESLAPHEKYMSSDDGMAQYSRYGDIVVHTESPGSAEGAGDGDIEDSGGATEDVSNDGGSHCSGCNTGRSDASPARGAGAARAAGLSKHGVNGSGSGSATSGMIPHASETGPEAQAVETVERHTEAMRALMNELAGELAVSTATRSAASEEWLTARIGAAEEVLASVRAGVLPSSSSSSSSSAVTDASKATDVSALAVGIPGHADIVREASHYLSAIKGVAAQGWSYVDNEIQRMERQPVPSAKAGFQSRREVIHTFRYLLLKARQFASENPHPVPGTPLGASPQQPAGRDRKSRRSSTGRSKDPTKSRYAKRSGSGRSKTSRRDTERPEGDNYGLYTLLVGAFLAVLATAFSSGRPGGAGRRREVVRQRAATRAARTSGSYVDSSQHGVLVALLLRSCIHLKRWWVAVSVHVRGDASVVRRALIAVGMGLFVRLRSALDLRLISYGMRVIGNLGRSKDVEPGRFTVSRKSSGSTTPLQRQRSRKQVKKAPAQGATRRRSETGSSPVSTREPAATTATRTQAARSGCCETEVRGLETQEVATAVLGDIMAGSLRQKGSKKGSTDVEVETESSGEDVTIPGVNGMKGEVLDEAGRDRGAVEEPEVCMAVADDIAPMSGSSIDEVPSAGVANFSKVAVAAAAALARTSDLEGSVTVLPSTITADQVKALVEEDELAWEQAKQAERGQNHRKQTASRSDWVLPSGFAKRTAAETSLRHASLARESLADQGSHGGVVTNTEVQRLETLSGEREDEGWSEVVSGGSRWRTHGGAPGARGRGGGGGGGGGRPALLSMRNIRAATRPARSSSPGSDPATTTSASSSECSDASKEAVVRPNVPRGGCPRNAPKQQIPQASKSADSSSSKMKHHSGNWRTQCMSTIKCGVAGSSRAARPQVDEGRAPPPPGVQKWSSDSKVLRPSRSAQATWPDSSFPHMRSPRVGRSGRLSSSNRTTAGAGVRVEGRSVGGHAGTLAHETLKGAPRSAVHRPGRLLPAMSPAARQGHKRLPSASQQPHVDGRAEAPSNSVRAGPSKSTTAACRDSKPEAFNGVSERATMMAEGTTNSSLEAVGGFSSGPELTVRLEREVQLPEKEVNEDEQPEQGPHHGGVLSERSAPAVFEGPAPVEIMPTAAPGGEHEADGYQAPFFKAHDNDLPREQETHVHQVMYTSGTECCSRSVNAGGDNMNSMTYPQQMVVSGMSSMTAPVSDGDDDLGASGVYSLVRDMSYEGSQNSLGSASGHGDRDGFSPEFTPALTPSMPPPHVLMLAPGQSHDQYHRLAGVTPQHQQQPSPPPPPPPIQDSTGMPMYCHVSHQPTPPQGMYYPPGPAMMGGGIGLMSRGISNGGLEPVLGALCWQVEYYFSVENLVKDVYLRSLMDPDGFVDVSKILVFNRVRKMTSDISVLVAAMRRSSELEVRDQEHNGEVQVRTRHSPLHWVSREPVLPPPPLSSETALDNAQQYSFQSGSPQCAPYDQSTEDGVAVESDELNVDYGGQRGVLCVDEERLQLAIEPE